MKQTLILLVFAVLWGGHATEVLAEQKNFVAVIITGDLDRYRLAHEAFVQKLKASGLTEDRLQIYVQTPNPDAMSWNNSIRKAVGIGADAIVTYGAPATLSAKKEARGVPVLFADVYDPVGLDIVRDIGVPVKNIAGVSNKTPLETLLKTFREICPAQTMGVLFSSNDEGSVLQLRKLADLAQKVGLVIVPKDVPSPKEMGEVLRSMAGSIDSIFVSDSAVLNLKIKDIMDFSAEQNLPVVSQIPTLCDQGALVTLEADPAEQGEVVASLLISLLGGTPASAMELHTPRKVSLVINLQVSRELNYKVSFQTLSAATRVVR
ncbi:ABC transporter substrate-binding protein [Trichloromonas sp.]|uniref:ABC transporter substrate-binding protein n=1 Tax=Trichloromonas sp. TaxID=3069249 RepID=UPI003D8193D6